MSLEAGARIGVFEIVGVIGAGGMGEVYRARDTRLNREVAIKVLPEIFLGDTERLARFRREAQLLASLNHPNIATIHGLEEKGPSTGSAQATYALVMELVEGSTLADRIADGALPFDEAIAIAKQIADALEAAHEQGIVHRDLKPANIKLRPDRTVKVLDFGLAKALEAGAGEAGRAREADRASMSPTITSPAATRLGMIMGTAAYMAPEQARGKTVDKRADIWAFGCVVYEMLTGQRAFPGEEISDTLAAVLKDEPSFDRVPQRARALLRRCFEKDPKRRLRDIGDAMSLVDTTSLPASASKASHKSLWLAWAIAASGIAIGLAFALLYSREESLTPRAIRFELQPPNGMVFRESYALSPDGRNIAFVADSGNAPALWIHSFETGQDKSLEKLGSFTNSFFWSPDSRSIAFSIQGQLRRVDVATELVQTICDVSFTGWGGGAWGASNEIIFGSANGGLMKVPASGGTPTVVTILNGARKDVGHFGPKYLPDGRTFVYFRNSQIDEFDGIYVGSLDLKPEEQSSVPLVRADSRPSWVTIAGAKTGYLLFERQGALLAQPFDPNRRALTGDAIQVAQQIAADLPSATFFSASGDGTLAYRPSVGTTGFPTWVSRDGREGATIGGELKNPEFPRLSPDGKKLAIGVQGNLWVYDLDGRPPIKLTFDGSQFSPLWTPDGKRLVYESSNATGLQSIAAEVGASPVPASPDGHFHPHGWLPLGGELVAVQFSGGQTGTDIVKFPMGAKSTPEPIVKTPSREGVDGTAMSPDGRWIAYISNVTGSFEVWVQPYPGPGSPVRVSPKGGSEPLWSHDGRELFYLEANRLMAVAVVDTQSGFNFKPAAPLFEFRYIRSRQPPSYDVAADGRFVVLKAASVAPATITVIVNWIQTLNRRN